MRTQRLNLTLANACKEAENQYNTIVEWYGELDTSDASDALIESMRIVYHDTLAFLREHGVGGVLINGIFRYTDEE